MKRIIKNNLVLIVVLGICLVVTIGLLVWTAMEYIQMSNYINQTGQLRSDIATLIKKTPAPVEGNIPLIKTDTTLYAGAAEKLRRRFGHPFRPALEQFISILRQSDGERIPLTKFREDFLVEWNKGDRSAQKYSDYKSFQRRFRNWPEAMQAFRTAAEKVTTEPITDNSIDDMFLGALGVPRQFDGRADNLQRFMAEYRRSLLEITKDKVLFETPEAANFSFTISANAGSAAGVGQKGVYLAEDYPMIAQQWEIIGDMVKRAADSGINSFVSFRKRTIQPEKVGGFDVFHYSIEITGTMASIRKFVNLLDQAFQENRVYVVRSIFLYQDGDGAKKLLTPDAILPILLPGMTGPNDEFANLQPGRRRRRPERSFRPESDSSAAAQAAREEAARKAKEEEEKSLPYNLRTGYGEKLIGKSDLCRAIIDVEYIMESGNGVQ